jgi:hypothetical protein
MACKVGTELSDRTNRHLCLDGEECHRIADQTSQHKIIAKIPEKAWAIYDYIVSSREAEACSLSLGKVR